MTTYYQKYRQYQSNQPYRFNSFRLDGLEKIEVGYRIIQINNLMEDDDFEKKIRQLSNLISGDIKMPTEPIRVQGEMHLAVIGLKNNLKTLEIQQEYELTPDLITTLLQETIYPLNFQNKKNRTEAKLARKALTWAVDNALKSHWWKYRNRFISREADENKSTSAIQVFPAFYLGFTMGADGTFELTIDPSVCNIERRSLHEKYGSAIPNIKGKRFLYRNGLEFYEVDAVGLGKQANQDIMKDPKTNETVSIQQHLSNRWQHKNIPLIENLDGNALTVSYKTKSQKSRKAHSQLLFELVGVEGTDEGDETPHNQSIMNPDFRGRLTERIIGELSQRLQLFGVKLNPSRQMRKLNGEVKTFRPPKIRLADDEELTTNLRQMGKDRFYALKQLGSADSTDFEDEQLFICGESIPNEIRLDFKKRFCDAVSQLYGKSPIFKNVSVKDENCSVMRTHYNAIESAIGNHHGYGLLLLPKQRKPSQTKKLHNHLKRNLWGQVQSQCALIESISEFYMCRRNGSGDDEWIVRQDKISRYNSYLRFLALGYLEVNQKVLWKLAEGTLRNEVHIGIDVYQDLAVFTFIYGNADLVTFQLSKARRGEKLNTSEVRDNIVKNLRADLIQLNLTSSSIVFHRDGRIFDSEIRGINLALEELKPLFSENFKHGIVEIHKTSMNRPRLYKWESNKFNNPEMGTFVQLNSFEGVLATTGEPLLRRGTAQPLAIEVIDGDIVLEDLAHDIYALSHLSFASPGSAMSLPFTIALADKVLKESSPGKEINLYDEEDEVFKKSSFSQTYLKKQKIGVATV